MKCFNLIKSKLNEHGFEVKESDWEYDEKEKAVFYFTFKAKLLSEKIKWKGPPLRAKQHVKVFKKKYKITFVEGDYIYTSLKRKYRKPEDLIKSLIKDDYIKERTKKVRFIG